MLGLDNPIHIAFVLIVLLLIFGAKRLPEMGKSMGEGLRGFKDSLSGETSVTQMETDHSPVRIDELTPAAPAEPVLTPQTVVTPEPAPAERAPVNTAA